MSADGGKVNIAFVAGIAAVATIGGFMFGYDSGVINGTQKGLEAAFNLTEFGTGLNVAAILLGCAFGAFARAAWPTCGAAATVMIISALLFIISALGTGAAPHLAGLRRVPPDRRPGRGRGLGAVPRLHLGGHAREHPRPPVVRAADHDHHRPDRRVPGQLLPGQRRRRQLDRRVLAGPAGLALDVLDAGHPGGHLPPVPCCSSRKARATWWPRAREAEAESRARRLFGAEARAPARSPRSAPRWPPITSPSCPTCWTPSPRSCARSCGPAWSWPSSSSWSASTSSSTTARCCGSRSASPRPTRLKINILSGHPVDPGLPAAAIGADRQDRPQAAAADRLGRHGRDPGPR